MDIKQHVTTRLANVEKKNKQSTDRYKAKLKEDIRVNLLEKKQTVQANQGLIDRYYNAQPRELTQMQQAMKEAVCNA